VWRGQPASKVLDGKKVSAMSGSATEQWVKDRLQTLQIGATYVPVADYRDGVQKLINHETDVFFGERSVVLGVLDDQTRPAVVVMDRLFTQEPLGLALARGDDDFRLVVDRALSGYYGSGEFGQTYAKWFGAPDEATKSFFQWSTLSE
jgi:polar amino acid transport system substrate-binding protein